MPSATTLMVWATRVMVWPPPAPQPYPAGALQCTLSKLLAPASFADNPTQPIPCSPCLPCAASYSGPPTSEPIFLRLHQSNMCTTDPLGLAGNGSSRCQGPRRWLALSSCVMPTGAIRWSKQGRGDSSGSGGLPREVDLAFCSRARGAGRGRQHEARTPSARGVCLGGMSE